MGDYNYTCSLTHTAIQEDDRVFFCVVPEPRGTKHLVTTLDLRSSMFSAICRTPTGCRMHYKDQENLWPSQCDLDLKGNWSVVKPRAFFGEYDGYGYMRSHTYMGDPFFMAHEQVAMDIADHMNAPRQHDARDVLYAVVRFAAFVREELFAFRDGAPVGIQYVDDEEIGHQRALMNMKAGILLMQEARLRRED